MCVLLCILSSSRILRHDPSDQSVLPNGGVTDRASMPPALSYCLWIADLEQSPLTDTVLFCLAAELLLRVLPSTPVHTLLLSNKGTESSYGHHLV
jgi:hypothetical protein